MLKIFLNQDITKRFTKEVKFCINKHQNRARNRAQIIKNILFTRKL